MNIHEIIALREMKRIVSDLDMKEIIEESRTLEVDKIVDGCIVWKTNNQLNEADENTAGRVRRIPTVDGWFSVEFPNGQIGTYDSREAATTARNTWLRSPPTATPDVGSVGDNDDVRAFKDTRESTLRRRAASSLDRSKIRRDVARTKGLPFRLLRRLAQLFGAWYILEEFLGDIWAILQEAMEDPTNIQEHITNLKNLIRFEGSRVLRKFLTFAFGALAVAATARLVVSGLLQILRAMSTITGPIGAAIVISLTLVVEGAMWYFITTDKVQGWMQNAVVFVMQNLMPGAISAFTGEVVDSDDLTRPLMTATEEATQDMVDAYSGITAEEADELAAAAEEASQNVERNDDPEAAPQDRTAPAAQPNSRGATRAMATPDQSIASQVGTLDW